MGKNKLNPELMVGDEILVLDTNQDKGASFNAPKIYIPYVVMGLRHNSRAWNDDAQETYYEIEPIGLSDEERLGELLAGGGHRRLTLLYGSDSWVLNPGFLRGEINEHNEYNEQNGRDEVQHIVDSVYPHIVNNLGPSEYLDEIPTVELHKDIYERISGVEGMQGEESESSEAQYERHTNTIYIYYPNMKNEKHVIQSLLHEYTHSLQNPEDSEGNREDGYENDQHEKESLQAEGNWEDYLIYLQKNINEHKESKVNPELKVGDIIRVIDFGSLDDGDRPERFGTYKVLSKGKTQHHFNQQKNQAPKTWYQILSVNIDVHYDDDFTIRGAKRLYWGDTWIYADTPTATKVDRKTISEHKEIELSPVLEKGDIIRILDIDGEHERMPERFGIYSVVSANKSMGYVDDGGWYDLQPTEPLKPGYHIQSSPKTIYRGDVWVKMGSIIKEQEQPGLSPELELYDTILVVDIDRERENGETPYTSPGSEMRPKKYVPYTVVEKVYNGHSSEWDFKYTVVPKDKLVGYEKTFDNGRGSYTGFEKLLYPWIYEWIYADTQTASKVDRLTISEQKELNQPLVMGDIIRVVDVDKGSTYEIPKYQYDTGNSTGNSLMTNHHREQVHGEETYPKPMTLYGVTSKSLYRPNDRDYLNPYWMIWPVELRKKVVDGIVTDETEFKVQDAKDLHQPILTEKDTWMIIKKHHSNIEKDMEIKQKEYDDSGRHIISRLLDEQDEPIDTQGGEIIRGDTDNDYNDYSDEEIDKRKTYDSDEENETGDGKPFTPLEGKILKTLHKYLTKDELEYVATTEDPHEHSSIGKQFWTVMKLFGISSSHDVEHNTRLTRYAKWALDNWSEEGDYINIENPIKVPLKWYNVDRDENGSQVEYKSGSAEVLGYDEDDAGTRADYDFYAWGGEMETHDYGDYESYDSEITHTEFIRMDESVDKDPQKTQDLLFNFWRKVGPTLDKDKLKLIGFNMDLRGDLDVVWDNLREYYGGEELDNIVQERLEGLQDGWEYEYIVTDIHIENDNDITLDVLVNGDTMVPMHTGDEFGHTIADTSLWDISEKVITDEGGPYDEAYDHLRESIEMDIKNLLIDLPVDSYLDSVEFSKPGTFEELIGKNDIEMTVVTEDEEVEITIRDNDHPYTHEEYDDFISYVIDELKIQNSPSVYIEKEATGDYTGGSYRFKGGSERIRVRCKGRSLVDILRSIAHELVHHKQKEDGKFKNQSSKGIPEVGGMIEDEANAIAGRLIKKYGKDNEGLYEQVMVDKGDMLKSDIFRILSNRFTLTPTDYSEIKDNEGNYYGIYDINLEEYVKMSDLMQGVLDFVAYGVESGDFKEEDIQKGVTAITDWVSLMMNQEKEYLN